MPVQGGTQPTEGGVNCVYNIHELFHSSSGNSSHKGDGKSTTLPPVITTQPGANGGVHTGVNNQALLDMLTQSVHGTSDRNAQALFFTSVHCKNSRFSDTKRASLGQYASRARICKYRAIDFSFSKLSR
ncbi:hypothetical protein [Chlamydia buteonis]|uniref:hypothetical protein n=1 Tax=Chlamydia buteonis TaxID=2494525 RepID=UPI00344EDFAA